GRRARFGETGREWFDRAGRRRGSSGRSPRRCARLASAHKRPRAAQPGDHRCLEFPRGYRGIETGAGRRRASMRILIYAYAFLPHLGGIETSTDALARGFLRLGHQVCVVTRTPNPLPEDFPFKVVRRPGPLQLLRLVCWSQVVLHNHISLRAAWPMLLCRRRWVIAHQTGLRRADGGLGLRNRLKRALLPFARSVAISESI